MISNISDCFHKIIVTDNKIDFDKLCVCYKMTSSFGDKLSYNDDTAVIIIDEPYDFTPYETKKIHISDGAVNRDNIKAVFKKQIPSGDIIQVVKITEESSDDEEVKLKDKYFISDLRYNDTFRKNTTCPIQMLIYGLESEDKSQYKTNTIETNYGNFNFVLKTIKPLIQSIDHELINNVTHGDDLMIRSHDSNEYIVPTIKIDRGLLTQTYKENINIINSLLVKATEIKDIKVEF